MNEVQGQNLHDTLVEDRRLWKTGGLQMGLKYYAEKKQKFSDPTSTMNMLKPTNPSDQVDDHLQVALLAVVESKANLQQYKDWCASAIG